MSLLPLTVVGPLSNLNTEMEVTGQVVGSTVMIYSNVQVVASGSATSADQVFVVMAGAHVTAGDMVTAVQVLGLGTPSAAFSASGQGAGGTVELRPCHVRVGCRRLHRGGRGGPRSKGGGWGRIEWLLHCSRQDRVAPRERRRAAIRCDTLHGLGVDQPPPGA
jgi:hypothetical protein